MENGIYYSSSTHRKVRPYLLITSQYNKNGFLHSGGKINKTPETWHSGSKCYFCVWLLGRYEWSSFIHVFSNKGIHLSLRWNKTLLNS